MTGKRKASDDAPGTPRPPAPRREAESDEEYASPSANLVSGDSGGDGDQSTRVVVPPRDPQVINVMDASFLFLQKQERELPVNLRGLSDGSLATGEENEASSPWRFVALSQLILTQPPAADQPSAAAVQADHSFAEAAHADRSLAEAAPAAAPAPATVVRAHVCFSLPAGLSDGGSAAGEEKEVSSPWKFVRLSELIVPQPPAADQSAAERVEICRACGRWTSAMPRVPYRHVCFCVPCRHNPSARISCWVCGAGRRSSIRRVWS